jgi:hypothetical protein
MASPSSNASDNLAKLFSRTIIESRGLGDKLICLCLKCVPDKFEGTLTNDWKLQVEKNTFVKTRNTRSTHSRWAENLMEAGITFSAYKKVEPKHIKSGFRMIDRDLEFPPTEAEINFRLNKWNRKVLDKIRQEHLVDPGLVELAYQIVIDHEDDDGELPEMDFKSLLTQWLPIMQTT